MATVPKQVNSINEFIAEEVNSHPGLFTGFGTFFVEVKILGCSILPIFISDFGTAITGRILFLQ